MTNTLHDALFAPHAGSTRPFLHLPDGSTLSHAAFFDLAGRLSGRLRALGVRPGDRIVVQVDKSPAALALYSAAVRSGVVFVPLNTAYTPEEVAYFLTDAEPKLHVTTAARRPVAPEVQLETLEADGTGSLIDGPANLADPVDRTPEDLAAILYTSGTTGRSKGAMLTHRNLLSNALTLTEAWGFTDRDVLIHALPIFHTHGLFVAVNISLLARSEMIFFPAFDLDGILAAFPRATAMMGVPTFYTRLLADDRLTEQAVASMRLFISGSAPLLADTHAAWSARTGHAILERYGMTETNMSTSNPLAGPRVAGTVGPPLPGIDLRITAGGAEVPKGDTGMIEVRGPNVFAGYWRMPEKTAEEFRDDGYFVTGDLGRLDENGYVQIVGREKDLIISGGENIYPKEIELLIDALPAVRESAVCGAPDPDFGERVIAFVVPAPGAAPTPDDILARLDGLARFKRPRRIEIVDALPRNAMGKVQKNVLRDRASTLS